MEHAVIHENGRVFTGFLRMNVGKIRACEAEVIALPVEDNPAHANIVYSFIDMPLGEGMDNLTNQKLKLMMTQLAKEATFVSKEEAQKL